MSQHCNRRSARQQLKVAQHVKQVEANHFFNLLTSPQLLAQVEAHLPEHRERKFPPTATLAMFLGEVLSADGSCQNAVNEALITTRLLSGMNPGSASALAPGDGQRADSQTAALLTEAAPPGWLWRGRQVKLVDGTTASMQDAPENQARFPQSGEQQAGTGEHGLFRRLKDCFVAGDVMLADGYFCSYFLIAEMQRCGVDVLFEQHGARSTDFRCGQQLGARDHRVNWQKSPRPEWLSGEDYRGYPDEITVREVKVGRKMLVTTFLNPRKTPKGELGQLFWQRWNVELDLRNVKSTLGMERFSCKPPAMVEKELWVSLLAYNLIRLLMAEAAGQAGALPC